MPKRPSHHRVKRHHAYTVAEAAETVEVHRQTVIRWIHDDGLPAETERRPWLICGEDLKGWLIGRCQARKAPLTDGQIYCLPCRSAKRPAGQMADYRAKTPATGQLIGLCPDCGGVMHRFVRRVDLDRIAGGFEVIFQ